MGEGPISQPSKDKRIDVVLAEFSALRGEMTTRTTIQATLLGTGLTGIGVIIGFAVGGDGNRSLLVLVPIASALVLFLYANESYRVVVLGDHIRRQFVYLRDVVSDQAMPSWEDVIQTPQLKPTRWIQGALDGVLDVALIATSVTSLVFAENAEQWLYWTGGIMLFVTSCVRLWVAFRGPLPRGRSRSSA